MPAVSLLALTLTLTTPTADWQHGLPAASANHTWAGVSFVVPSGSSGPWGLDFRAADAVQAAGSAPAKVFEYSDAYRTRLRIHKDASFAMLPLFAAEAVVGEKLFHNPNAGGLRTLHGVLNVGILGLFGLDTVTGLWNLKEGWQDPQGRVRRLIHSLLMLTADVGFVWTDRLAPSRRAIAAGNTSGAVTHRDVAAASISVATIGYLIMIFR
jgi:hypothetical protein